MAKRLAKHASGLWLPTAEPIRQRSKPFRKPSFFIPGCAPCCSSIPTCQIFADDFSGGLGAWSQEVGAWSDSGARLSTTDDNGQIVYGTTQFDYVLTAKIRASSVGDESRIIVRWQDISNYAYCQFKFGSGGHVRIYDVVAGVATQLTSVTTSAMTTGADHSVHLCVRQGVFVSVLVNGAIGCYATTNAITLNGIGFGTGAVTGTATFDDLVIEELSDDCLGCPNVETKCAACDDQIAADSYLIENTTFAGTCAGILNGAFVVDFAGELTFVRGGVSGTGLIWLSPVISSVPLTDGSTMDAEFMLASCHPAAYYFCVYVRKAGVAPSNSTPTYSWGVYPGGAPPSDCLAWDQVPISRNGFNGIGPTLSCTEATNPSDRIVKVTSL